MLYLCKSTNRVNDGRGCVYIKLQYFSVHFLILQYFLSDPQAFLTYASSVQVGAQSGIHECKHQFALEKWNCPERTLQMSTHNTLRTGNTPLSAGDVLGACTTCTNTDVVPAVVPCTNHWTEKIKTSQSSCVTATVHASNAALTQYLMCNIQFESNFFFLLFRSDQRDVVRPRHQCGRGDVHTHQELQYGRL